MVEIQNRLNQPLLVHRGKASPLHLLAHGRAVIEDEEAESPHVQALLASGVLQSRRLRREHDESPRNEPISRRTED
jgi:hypothetical protein